MPTFCMSLGWIVNAGQLVRDRQTLYMQYSLMACNSIARIAACLPIVLRSAFKQQLNTRHQRQHQSENITSLTDARVRIQTHIHILLYSPQPISQENFSFIFLPLLHFALHTACFSAAWCLLYSFEFGEAIQGNTLSDTRNMCQTDMKHKNRLVDAEITSFEMGATVLSTMWTV